MTTISQPWLCFCIAYGVMALATILMGQQGAFFYTKDPIRRKFSILEMEFPGKPNEIADLVRGIYLLPGEAAKTIKAVKTQLLLDCLLFIPATYGGIFILCMQVAHKMPPGFGCDFFVMLAWGQGLSFILDYIENTYFLSLIGQRDLKSQSKTIFVLMRVLECFKWGFALVGAACGFSAMVYYWLSGKYDISSLPLIGVFFAEIILFIILSASAQRLSGKNKQKKDHALVPGS